MKYEQFMNVLFSSKAYKFEGSVIEITDYYSGESIKLDLSLLPEEVFEEMVVEEDEEDYWE